MQKEGNWVLDKHKNRKMNFFYSVETKLVENEYPW